MLPLNDASLSGAALGPKNLWEAVTVLSRIQEEQGFALKDADLGRMNRLLSEQSIAWAYVRGFAEQLVKRGQAPEGMVDRLRDVLKIHEQRETELTSALGRLRQRLRQVQAEELEELPKAA